MKTRAWPQERGAGGSREGGALRALYQGYKGQGQHQALLSRSVVPAQPSTATAYLDPPAFPAQPCLPQDPACGTPGPRVQLRVSVRGLVRMLSVSDVVAVALAALLGI